MIPAPALSVTLSTAHAGARPVVATLRARYEMQCGWPGPGSLVIRLPAGMLPAHVPPASVLVNGTRAAAVISSNAQRQIAVALPPRPQLMCDSIGPGTLTVVFTRASRMGNPNAAGSYVIRATHAADRFAGRLVIRP
jgi:hypothetical protein